MTTGRANPLSIYYRTNLQYFHTFGQVLEPALYIIKHGWISDFLFLKYRVSHLKLSKVIWLCWRYRFRFLLIFWVLCVYEKGTFIFWIHQFLFFWCCEPSMVQLLNNSCSLMTFNLIILTFRCPFQVIKGNKPS